MTSPSGREGRQRGSADCPAARHQGRPAAPTRACGAWTQPIDSPRNRIPLACVNGSRSRVDGDLARCLKGRLEPGVASAQQTSHVPLEHEKLGDFTQQAKAGSELDDVDHERLRAVVHGGEDVRVPPPLKRPAMLLIDEPDRSLVLRDRRRHPKRDPEMAGTPAHRVPEFHYTACDSRYRTLA